MKAAETRALRKQKIKVKINSVSSFPQINTRDETPHNPQSFRPKTFRPFKYDNQANIQHRFNNHQGKYQEQQQKQKKKHQEKHQEQLCFGYGKPGHYRNECRSYQKT